MTQPFRGEDPVVKQSSNEDERKKGGGMYMEQITMDEFAAEIKRGRIVVLPIGATEEHGPHLPLGTDTIQIESVVEGALKEKKFLVAPTVRYGICSSTRNFPGTLTISCELLERLVSELLLELERNAVKKIIMISGHAGADHMAAMRVAAKKFVRNSCIKVVVASIADLVLSSKENSVLSKFPAGDKHAGFIETSCMLYLNGDLVRKNKIPEKSIPQFPDPLIISDAEKYFPSGVMGDPTGSSADDGRAIIALAVKSFVKLIAWFEKQ